MQEVFQAQLRKLGRNRDVGAWCHTAPSHNGSSSWSVLRAHGFRASCMAGAGKSHFVFACTSLLQPGGGTTAVEAVRKHCRSPCWQPNAWEPSLNSCLSSLHQTEPDTLTPPCSSPQTGSSLAGARRAEPSPPSPTPHSLPLALAPSATLSPATAQTPPAHKSALAPPETFIWDKCHIRLLKHCLVKTIQSHNINQNVLNGN